MEKEQRLDNLERFVSYFTATGSKLTQRVDNLERLSAFLLPQALSWHRCAAYI